MLFFSPVAFLFLSLATCVTYTHLLTTIILFINLIKWILHYALSKKLISLPKSAKQTSHNGAYWLEFIELQKALLRSNLKYYHVRVSNLSSCQTSCTSVVHKYDLLLHSESNHLQQSTSVWYHQDSMNLCLWVTINRYWIHNFALGPVSLIFSSFL